MTSNFDKALAFTLQFEGGYVDHPRDPGGATNLGITIGTLRAWRKRPVTKADVRALTKSEAARIYRANYWDALALDREIPGLDAAMFDAGVNSGPGRARRWRDGLEKLGTIAAVKAFHKRRLSFVRGLRTWGVFGKGWARRIAACEAFCVRLASGSDAPARLETEAAKAKTVAKRQERGAALAGGGVVATPAIAPDAAADAATQLSALPVLALGAVVLAAILFLIWRSRINRLRAEAYALEKEKPNA